MPNQEEKELTKVKIKAINNEISVISKLHSRAIMEKILIQMSCPHDTVIKRSDMNRNLPQFLCTICSECEHIDIKLVGAHKYVLANKISSAKEVSNEEFIAEMEKFKQ